MEKHKVRLHDWIDGVLKWTEHEFETLGEAHTFLKKAKCHSAKLFNPRGNMIFEETKLPQTSDYA